ncbi:MAG: homoserine dehydrogenase, partial [Blastocatellia bacterium]|nr:homoserine dehydrogenase [Blastocatellia bacterium]
GAIPILAAIRDGLSGERPNEILAILNGTTNYIITEMQKTGRPFAEILKVAQELGYAEADPALDVDGIDARDKLSILSMIAFGIIVEPDSIATTGITGLSQDDLRYASDLGYTVKLICSAKPIDRVAHQVALRVTPSLVSKDSLFAAVNGSLNAILLSGEFGGQFFFSGRGAGSGPTGSAIVGDIIRIARGIKSSPFGYKEFGRGLVASNFVSRHFVRFVTKDIPGVIARIASIFAKYEISIDSVVQERGHNEKEKIPFVITLKESDSSRVEQAAREMQELDFLASRPYVMPIMS